MMMPRFTAFTKEHRPLFSAEDSQKIGDMCIEYLKAGTLPAAYYVYDGVTPPISYYRYTVYILGEGIVAGVGHQFRDFAEVEHFYYQRHN
jgi:hypothetical protein